MQHSPVASVNSNTIDSGNNNFGIQKEDQNQDMLKIPLLTIRTTFLKSNQMVETGKIMRLIFFIRILQFGGLFLTVTKQFCCMAHKAIIIVILL